jgi:hypothetical protein
MAPITPTHALWPGTLESKYSEYQLTSPVSSLLLLPQEPSEPVNKNEEAGGFVKGGTPACLLSRGRTTACRCARTARASARPTPAPRAGRCGGAAPARRPTLGRATPTASPARCAPPPAARARPVCKGLGSRRGRRVLARARALPPGLQDRAGAVLHAEQDARGQRRRPPLGVLALLQGVRGEPPSIAPTAHRVKRGTDVKHRCAVNHPGAVNEQDRNNLKEKHQCEDCGSKKVTAAPPPPAAFPLPPSPSLTRTRSRSRSREREPPPCARPWPPARS